MNGAIPETVPNAIEWKKETTVKELIATLQAISREKTKYAVILSKNYHWAMSQTWSSLAKDWLDKLLPSSKE